MDIRTIQSKEFALRARAYRLAREQAAAAKIGGPPITRRQFLKTAGAALLGSAIGSGLSRASRVEAANGPGDPRPIPGGTPVLGGGFHLFGPGIIDPVDAEPSSITNFDGFVGLAYISGAVTRTNTATGEVLTLPFLFSDMRFMEGVFRGMDGQMHQGAFGFVWIDVYEPGPGSQIHDLNPTAFPPTSLFWTLAIPGNGINVNLGKGSAVLQASNVPVFDYGSIPNALFGGPSTITGQTSFTVVWSGVNERLNIKNTDPVYGGFGGEFVRNSAQMEWTATAGDYQFVSAPLATSSSLWAELGHERNGVFFSP
jgi:hypothetical protein